MTHMFFVTGQLLRRAFGLLYHIVEKKQLKKYNVGIKLGRIYSCRLMKTEGVTLYLPS